MINVGTKHTTEHYKMYKSGKHWVTAMLATATLTTVAVTTNQINAHADSTDATGTTASETTTGGNAVTQTSAKANTSTSNTSNSINNQPTTNSNGGQNNSIPVNVDHSALDQAIQNAKNAGMNVVQNSTDNKTVDQNSLNNEKQNISKDYNNQVNTINQKTEQYKQEKQNQRAFNGTNGDHSTLDDAVKKAQSVSGLSVIKDDDVTVNVNSDNDAINKFNSDTQADYEKQISDINNAITTQKQAWDAYQKQIDKLSADQHTTGSERFTNGGYMDVTCNYDITWHYDKNTGNVVVTNVQVNLVRKDPEKYADMTNGFWDSYAFVKPDAQLPHEKGTYPWGDAPGHSDLPGVDGEYLWNLVKKDAMAFYTQDSNRTASPYVIKYATQTPYNAVKDSDGTYTLMITLDRWRTGDVALGQPNHPVWGVMPKKVSISIPDAPNSTIHYHYDVAKVIPPLPGVGQVDYQLHNLNVTTNPAKQWTEDGQNTNNKVYFDGDTAHATVSATLNDINDYDGIKDVFSISDDYSQLAKDATVTGATVTENGQDVTDQYNLSVHNGVVTMTRKNTNNMQDGTYVLNVTFKLNDDVAKGTQLTNQGFLTVGSHQLDVTPVTITTTTPNPHKDVAAGEINGTSENSINGQTVANGTVSTFPFTTNDLDANRAKKITDRAYEDTLDSHLTYKGFKAYIKDAQGQLEDVTSHIHATQNGQTITFTEDSYLIARYNQDLTQAVTTPIIDVYAQVNGDNVQIKNQYTLIQNGIKYTSNEVGIHTPEAPKPIKKDYNEDNVDIDGKTVLPGSTNKYEITADYDQYKGIQTSEDNIGKGFYIIDDYPEEALDADPSKFSAIDSTGKSVNDLNYKVYQSVSDAPQDVQEAIQQQGIKVNGAFIVASATNPNEYFTKYVQTGDSITVIMPMTVKDAYTGTYTNSAYEFDFGHGYATNIVTNNVPKITPTKNAVDSAGNLIQDNGNVPLNEIFKYDLHGAILPGGEGHNLTQYGFTDDYDQNHDEYQNTYQVVLSTDVKLKDGTVLKKGTDVTKDTTQSYDVNKGAIDIEFTPAFLKTVDMSKSTGFGADALAVFKRIAAGDVTNQYTNWINGKPYLSNVFKTHTPKPVTPTPKKPTPQPAKPAQKAPEPVVATVAPAKPTPQPAKPAAKLPQTGNSKSGLASLGFVGLLMALGSLGIGRKRKSA